MNNLELEVGGNYVMLSSESSVMAIINVVDDKQTTLNKIEQAIRDEKFFEDNVSIEFSLIFNHHNVEFDIKAKISEVGEESYFEKFSLTKTVVY